MQRVALRPVRQSSLSGLLCCGDPHPGSKFHNNPTSWRHGRQHLPSCSRVAFLLDVFPQPPPPLPMPPERSFMQGSQGTENDLPQLLGLEFEVPRDHASAELLLQCRRNWWKESGSLFTPGAIDFCWISGNLVQSIPFPSVFYGHMPSHGAQSCCVRRALSSHRSMTQLWGR